MLTVEGGKFDRFFHDVQQSAAPPLAFSRDHFRPPPRTPSSVNSSSRIARPVYTRSGANNDGSRKRARHSYDDSAKSTPIATPLNEWSDVTSLASSACFSSAPSPAPFVNTRYELAGGLDTPGMAAEARYDAVDHDNEYERNDARPNRLSTVSLSTNNGYFPETPATMNGDGILRRKRKQSPDRPGWTRSIVNTVGGIAWKGIGLCWSTAFGGFHAGGGTGYQMSASTPVIVENKGWTGVQTGDDVFDETSEDRYWQDGATPVPGQFPEDDFDFEQDSAVARKSPQSVQSAIRQHRIEKENNPPSDGNWVVVPNQTAQPSISPTPSTRPRNDSIKNPPHHRRSSSTASIAGTRSKIAVPSPRPKPSNTNTASPAPLNHIRTASNASLRSLRLASSATDLRSTSHRHSPSLSPTRSRHTHGHRRHNSSSLAPPFPPTNISTSSPRRGSLAPSSSSSSTIPAVPAAPKSPDIQHFERKVRAKERKEDENIRRLNRQLRDMIREGKEALGTKIHVEDEDEGDDDDGYDDEDDGGF